MSGAMKRAHGHDLKCLGATTFDRPDALLSLAQRVRRLAPSHRDPEAFHVEKSEIERELRRLARAEARL